MNIKDIEIGKHYRLKSSPTYGYVEPIAIYRKGQFDNPIKSKNVVECWHFVNRDDNIGFHRFFKPSDIMKEEVE